MTDRLNPEALDQQALEAAAQALRDDHANRAEYYVVPEWNDTPYGQKLVFRGRAHAAVSAYLAALPASRTVTTVEQFINQRPEYITALQNTRGTDDKADYHRWQGGAEARRQLAQALGWTVPHNPGETTRPTEGGGE